MYTTLCTKLQNLNMYNSFTSLNWFNKYSTTTVNLQKRGTECEDFLDTKVRLISLNILFSSKNSLLLYM